MTEDDKIRFIVYSIYWLSLIFIVLTSKKRVQMFIINFSIHIIYSLCILYGFQESNHLQGGYTGLDSAYQMLFLWLIVVLHALLNIIIAITKMVRNKKLDIKKIKTV